ncbi:voltage-dependent anion channel protein 2 [Cryptococcus gattii Ru294]|uniref:Voltage-dependent ion-selective channel, putative n=2 Tax=Cryptococcus gattii TaxID=37769 RepID=E6R270_CRYGW|nr:voltage-dependent ion-selective channel, putative [Cryptococcus gattii WM276]KIR56083.1 voltage-dependent anion channel protein 2 [Cryptococcus gattii Ru294]KIR81833.1 voltage-dependent anion channel protein 2 [Cryptococcus gattii EJB2]KIY36596.1 voltage-dependent anion channel protein 2 [Cryptococcus gattii E566]KJE04533.1 voltage-dependent anion channel protein 2 [Cryptococcus gattii NT-10]ADV21330.1 voltage-dependent ion-selective channel, putative [Cryptococcus gattii WM276]
MSQAVPPSWRDLGKSSSDLLLKDYPIQGTSLEVKTLTPSNVAFKVAGTKDAKTDAISGDIEGKYVDFKNGLTFTQGWTTANVLRTQLELENQIAKGLKFDLATTLNPAKASKSAILTAIYKQPSLHTRATVDLFKGPTFTADTVVGRDGFLVGAEASYDVLSGAITRYAGAVGFSAPEYAVTLHGLGNLSTFAASYYHKVSKDVEAAAKAVYDTKSTTGNVSLEVGAKTYLDNAAFVKAKINNAGVLSLGYTQALRPGVKASAGLAIDTTRLNEPTAGQAAHKVGASIVFNA